MRKPPSIYLLFNEYRVKEYRLFLRTHEWVVFRPDGTMISGSNYPTSLAKSLIEDSVAILK